MKESSWEECVENGTARSVSKDMARVDSLIETSNERVKSLNSANLECNFAFEGLFICTWPYQIDLPTHSYTSPPQCIQDIFFL